MKELFLTQHKQAAAKLYVLGPRTCVKLTSCIITGVMIGRTEEFSLITLVSVLAPISLLGKIHGTDIN